MKNQVAVLMPVHGSSPYLGQTLQSVSQSTLANFDLVIVLDRCTNPDLYKFVREIPENISVSILQSEKPGIVPALNLGLTSIQSQYVARIDADDEMQSDRLDKQVRHLTSHPNVVCVGTQLTLINEESEIIGHTRYPIGHEQIKKRLFFQNCLAHPSVMFRRDSVVNIGGYRKFLEGAEDYDLWLRLMRVGNLSNLDENLTRYRISENQFTRKNTNNQELLDNCVRLSYFLPSTTDDIFEDLTSNQQILKKFYKEYTEKLRQNSGKKFRLLKSSEYMNAYVKNLGKSDRGFTIGFPKSLLKSFLLTPIRSFQYVLESFKHRAIRKMNKSKAG